MKRNILFALAVGFVLGAAVMKMASRPFSTPLPTAMETQSEAACVAVASRPALALPLIVAAGTVSAALKSETSPSFGTARSKKTRAELEEKLVTLLEQPFPQGRQIVRNDRDDGGIATLEQTEDGASINRTFSAKGELRSESLFSLSGEQVERSYYEVGKLKGFSWIRVDGSRIDIKVAASGLHEGRQDLLENGEKIITKYDEYGEVREKWRVFKNGRQVAL